MQVYILILLYCHKGAPDWKRVIPMREVDSILELMHTSAEKGGHAGRDSMLNAIGR